MNARQNLPEEFFSPVPYFIQTQVTLVLFKEHLLAYNYAEHCEDVTGF